MTSDPQALRDRSKEFAVRIVKLFRALPARQDAFVIGKQLLRSGTSVAANYRAACRARSKSEFCSKLGIVTEEADETIFWLELLSDTEIMPASRLVGLTKEANELLAIFRASKKTAERHRGNRQP